jgi:hypothetical protein
MCLHPLIVRSLIAAILAITIAGEARSAAQSPDDTGNPPVLINRPVCSAVEMFDDWLRCRAAEHREDRSRSLHRSVR